MTTHGTTIEWVVALAESRGMRADVWNPVAGCLPVGEGCRNCWAATEAALRESNQRVAPFYAGLTRRTEDGRVVFNGRTRFLPEELQKPLRAKRPTVYFVCSRADLFGEGVLDGWIDQVFAAMARSPQHLFLTLTKRPQRMRPFTPSLLLPNVWLGVSVWDQDSADKFIPALANTPAAKRFISAEPLLGPILLPPAHRVDWVIAGGESGRRPRPMHPEWSRSLRDQCSDGAIPYFFKQWGEWSPALPPEQDSWEAHRQRGGKNYHVFPDGVAMDLLGKKRAGRMLDSREWQEMPR